MPDEFQRIVPAPPPAADIFATYLLEGVWGSYKTHAVIASIQRWDTWTPPVKFMGLDVPKLNI